MCGGLGTKWRSWHCRANFNVASAAGEEIPWPEVAKPDLLLTEPPKNFPSLACFVSRWGSATQRGAPEPRLRVARHAVHTFRACTARVDTVGSAGSPDLQLMAQSASATLWLPAGRSNECSERMIGSPNLAMFSLGLQRIPPRLKWLWRTLRRSRGGEPVSHAQHDSAIQSHLSVLGSKARWSQETLPPEAHAELRRETIQHRQQARCLTLRVSYCIGKNALHPKSPASHTTILKGSILA